MTGPGRRARVVAALLAGALLAGAVATAGAAKLLTGRDVKDGSITLKDLAKPVRTKLATARAPGPAGPAGPAGAPGAAGAPGPPGVSEASVEAWEGPGTIPAISRGLVAVSSYEAGPVLAQANLTLVNTFASPVDVVCELQLHGLFVDVAEVRLPAAGGADTTTLSLSGAGPGPQARDNLANLMCTASAGNVVTYDDPDIILVKVGALG